MNSKSLLIAIAAFAVTATGAQAYMGPGQLGRTGLSPTQLQAFSEARELRQKGKTEEARDVLLEAGLDEDKIATLRKAAHAAQSAISLAVEENDYTAFKQAAAATPLADIITSEADFALFVEAHALRKSGQYTEARGIFDELGLEGLGHERRSGKKAHSHHGFLSLLTEEQQAAFLAAKAANDKETMQEILKEAGFDGGRGNKYE